MAFEEKITIFYQFVGDKKTDKNKTRCTHLSLFKDNNGI